MQLFFFFLLEVFFLSSLLVLCLLLLVLYDYYSEISLGMIFYFLEKINKLKKALIIKTKSFLLIVIYLGCFFSGIKLVDDKFQSRNAIRTVLAATKSNTIVLAQLQRN
jgi:hypothetical protein